MCVTLPRHPATAPPLAPARAHTPCPHPPARPLLLAATAALARDRQGGALFTELSGTSVTFASTLPANSFSGNTGTTNYGNSCYKWDSAPNSFTGSCG